MTINFSDVCQCVARIWFAAALLAGAVLAGCGDASASGPGKVVPKDRVETAARMFQERCKSAGEKIHKTVQGVEGIFLINLRPEEPNFDQQFALDDPYGADFRGEAYISSFLRGFYATDFRRSADVESHTAYRFVEAIDPADGKRYRYTGRIEEPGLTNPRFLKGYTRFVLVKTAATGARPRYGVRFDDISTRAEREYWIAGSSLKVIDLQTGAVVAERIGYMWDKGQGATDGERSPWLFAARNACPAFRFTPASLAQKLQTEIFVKKSLIPSTLDKQK